MKSNPKPDPDKSSLKSPSFHLTYNKSLTSSLTNLTKSLKRGEGTEKPRYLLSHFNLEGGRGGHTLDGFDRQTDNCYS